MSTVLVERTLPRAFTLEEIDKLREEKGWCFETNNVTWLHSVCSDDGLRMICCYEAPDAEAVRRANKLSGIPADRIWSAESHTPQSQG